MNRLTRGRRHRDGARDPNFVSAPIPLRYSSRRHALLSLVTGLTILCEILIAPATSHAVTITLSPGDNIQAAVKANPGYTRFILQPGVYRMQTVLPKVGDSFIGQAGAILNGSEVLTNWRGSGIYWTYTGAPAENTSRGKPAKNCADPTTGCAYPQDLYLNERPLQHKLRLPLTPGQWFFDYRNDVIYIVDSPIGRKVELSVARQAFSGHVNNVTVENLVVEKYASPLLLGAISPYGSNWIIKSNEVRLNHSGGIKGAYGHADNEQILNNSAHDNGQEGIGIGRGSGNLIEYNTMFNNGFANVIGENGGGKVTSSNTRILNNTYSNNLGVGLWIDEGARDDLISGNTISGSRDDGIRVEISHGITVTGNTLRNNAQFRGTGTCTIDAREIMLAQSDNTQVFDNAIISRCAGIFMTDGGRNRAVNNSVTDNTTTYTGSAVIANPIGGLDAHYPHALYDPANDDYFDYNTYHFGVALGFRNWSWNGTSFNLLSWSGWRQMGQDIHGRAD
jgi:parallel beta-helix repeat protein